MNIENLNQFLQNLNFFNNNTVHCSKKEEVDFDNPAYAKMDPHLTIEDDPEILAQIQNPAFKRYPRRPPSFDVMLNSVKAITKKVEHIKGFRFEISGVLSNNFLMGHTWNIPYTRSAGAISQRQMAQGMQKSNEGHYTLSTQYLGGTLRTQMDEPTVIVTGRRDSSGRLEAAIIKKINNYITCRLQGMFPNSDVNYAHMNLDVDIEGDDYNHTIKYGTGMWSFNMMQTIGNNLVLGFEFMNLTERKTQQFNYALKYNYLGKHHFYMQYFAPAESVTLAYALWLQKKAQLVTELEVNTSDGTTESIIGFKQKFSNTEIIATLNSKGKISTVMNIYGFAYQLKLCAVANYLKDSYKFGYGITMGQMG